ncbi:MAG: ComF family protein [Paramuribaculum sp.]|nr:ComF family protein [Paramuribaculum sp.]
MGIKSWLTDFVSLIFPDVCEVCDSTLVHGEKMLCLHCMYDIPRTKLHKDSFSEIHKRLAGNIPINKAASFFYYYKENPYARMIQKAKYNNRPRLAFDLAEMFAGEIQPDGFFNDIDTIIPVPIHWVKELKRGYNQSRKIAEGISSVTGIPVADNLIAARSHATQTRRSSFERWLNTRSIFAVENPEELDHKHILIVDDVITTGATLLRCAEAIHTAAPTATISVATLAFTRPT